MADPVKVEIVGLKKFRDDLRKVSKEMPKHLTKANKEAAEVVAGQSRTDASGGTPQQAAGAASIRAGATQTAGIVRAGDAKHPWMRPALMGSKERTGWYAADKYAASTGRQFPPWVGNQWDPGDSLDGHAPGEPYVLGPALRKRSHEVIAKYEDLIEQIARTAFPE